MRRVGALVALVLVLTAFAAPARAQYPPQRPTCQVNDSTVAPGQTVQVSGQNWQSSSQVHIRFRQGNDDQIYGPFPTDAQGSFSASVTIPADARPGPARLVVGGPDQNGKRTICRIQITVQDGGGEPPPPGGARCSVNDSTPAPGQSGVNVQCRHLLPRSEATIHFVQDGSSEQIATVIVNGAGRFGKSVSIPTDAHDGPAEIVVNATDEDGEPIEVRIQITVDSSGQLASLTVPGPLTPGTLALLLGTVLVVFVGARRRSRELLPRRR